MKEGPSGSAIRSRSQTTASCCGQKPWWWALRKRRDGDPGRHGRGRRAQANRCRSVESGLGYVKTAGWPFLRDQFGRCPDTDRAASGV